VPFYYSLCENKDDGAGEEGLTMMDGTPGLIIPGLMGFLYKSFLFFILSSKPDIGQQFT